MVLTHPFEAMAQLFAAALANDLPEVPNFNICPTNEVGVVTSDDGHRRLRPMRWGFVPQWYKAANDGPLLINTRAETIAEKPAFKAACQARRCLIPASGFYEWTKGEDDKRLPWYIYPADKSVFSFAGIWQDWERDGERLTTCAVVTTGANDSLSKLHHRMPVVIAEADRALWLGEDGKGAAALMRAAEDGFFDFYRVDPAVNSNRARGPDLIAPIAA